MYTSRFLSLTILLALVSTAGAFCRQDEKLNDRVPILIQAVADNDLAAVKRILASRPDSIHEKYRSISPEEIATDPKVSPEVLDALLTKGASLHFEFSGWAAGHPWPGGVTQDSLVHRICSFSILNGLDIGHAAPPSADVAQERQVKKLRLIMRIDPYLARERDHQLYSPHMLAAKWKNLGCMMELERLGASDGASICVAGSTRVLRHLISRGQNPNQWFMGTDALYAALTNIADPSAARALINAGAKVSGRHTLSGTPLLAPAVAETERDVSQRKDLIRIVLRHGQTIDLCDDEGRTTLHFAVLTSRGRMMVAYLLALGANPTLEDRDGLTALDKLRTIYDYELPESKEVERLLINAESHWHKRRTIHH